MRYTMTVLLFAVLNGLAWVAYHHWMTPRSDIVRVELASPGEGGLLAVRYASFDPGAFPRARAGHAADQEIVNAEPLSFRFNLPMDTADDASLHPPGRMVPALAGAWRWLDPQQLVFTPAHPALGTTYTVTLDQHVLRSLTGFRLAEAYSTTVHTLPLQVDDVRVLQALDDGAYQLQLAFSDEVPLAAAAAAISIVEGDGTPVMVRSWTPAGRFLNLETESLASRAIARNGPIAVQLTVAAGLAGRARPLGLPQARTMNRVLDGALRLERVRTAFEDGDDATLILDFNRPLQAETLRRALHVEPQLEVAIEVRDGGTSAVLHGAFHPGHRYAVVIDPPPAGTAGVSHVVPLPERMPVWIPDQDPVAWFPEEEGRLSAMGTRMVALKAVNLRAVTLRAWRLYDSNLLTWIARDSRAWSLEGLGRPVLDRRLAIGERKNAIQDLRIDLARELPPRELGDGVLLLELEEQPQDRLSDPDHHHWYDSYWRAHRLVVSLSDLALSCRLGGDGATVWVTSLASAQPVADVRVRLFSSKLQPLATAVSGADGLARLSTMVLPVGEYPSVVIADTPSGGLAWLSLAPGGALHDATADTGGEPWERHRLAAFIHAERGVWRPGDTVHLRAMVRTADGEIPPPLPLRWRFRRPDWKIWREEVATTLASGDLLLDLALPEELSPGHWQAELTVPGDERPLGLLALQIEDFLPDRMSVSFRHEGPGLVTVPAGSAQLHDALLEDGELSLTVQADYLFGRPAAGRTLKAWMRVDPCAWQPAGAQWEGWTFGDAAEAASVLDHQAITGTRIDLAVKAADAQGRGSWDLAPGQVVAVLARGRAHPWRLQSGGEVQEVGGRAVSASAPPLTLHPVKTWLGARLVEEGGSTVLMLALAGPASAVTPGQASVRIYQEHWSTVLMREHGLTTYHSTRDLLPVGDAVAVAVAAGAEGGRWTLPATLPPASYVVCAEWSAGRQLVSLAHRPGSPGGWQESISRERPDRCEVSVRAVAPAGAPASAPAPAPAATGPRSGDALVAVGGEALVAIRSPFPGRALVTVCTDRVVEARVVELTGTALELRLPVTAAWRPNAYVCVAVIRRVEPSRDLLLHRAWGVAPVRTEESAQRLAVDLEAPTTILPGALLALAGIVHDAQGVAVPGASVTIAVADEGILRLTSYRTPDPFAWLIRPRALGVAAWDAYADLLPELLRPGGESPTGGDGSGHLLPGRYQSPVTARRVVPMVGWSGLLTSDAAGRVQATVPLLPSFQGRVRVMAVAAAGARAGAGEGWCTVRGPLVLQSSWPRFAAPGDRFRVSVSLTNLCGTAGLATARLVLPADGLLASSVLEARQELAAGAEAQLSFSVTAAASSGIARATVVAELAPAGDARLLSASDAIELPVRPAAPRVTIGGEQAVTAATPWNGTIPGAFLPGSGTVEVRLGPRPALSLPRGLDYLYRYPYGCAEQVTSACFPLVHLRDLGDQIAPDLFLPAGITRRLNDGIARLEAMETEGGVAMWTGQRASWPWGTVYATHFLVAARKAGHAVPEEFLRRMLSSCRHLDAANEWRWAETQAYACYVEALAGQPAHALMQRLEELLKDPRCEAEIGPGTRCWLAAAWLEAGRKDLASALLPVRLPALRADRHLDGDLASPVRDRAVLLATLLDVAPDHPRIPALAQELAALAPWPSTQDTSFALIALGRYLRRAVAETPPSAVELRIDGVAVGPPAAGMALRWSGGRTPVVAASAEGAPSARAWLSWTATGVPLTPPADDATGLRVQRRWLDEHGHELGERAIHSGDLVQVELTVSAVTGYHGVVIEDLLPAGFEIENPRLASAAPQAGAAVAAFDSRHTEMRDDRFVAMGDLAQGPLGSWVMTAGYLARAVTPGTYTRPPVRAECMYDISLQGIAGSGMLTVLPAP